ncbi:MAG TPA: CaiB/BaiF CoA-transferase family protein [Hyphomicrobiaceae bacterium]|nr:CaiB/BaiF CoA-transferase family protein [Hyphomicrobiaceae bacterium]
MAGGKIERTGPLKGVRVIELAHVMAGPVCGLMLADMGADVIKVEKIQGGDDTRRQLPPDINGESAAYMMMNRNKRGVVLDLKSEGGKEVLRRLVKTADILIENYRSDTMPSLGLGYEDLKKINPGLIYAAITGFGRTGPMASNGGFDLVAQGMSGLMSITGEGPGRQPVKVGAPVCDITAGLLLTMGVLAAYAHKLKTGEGQFVDTSLFEAGITHTYWQSAIAFATGVAPGPLGSAHPLNAPYQAFETADGWINIGAANQANWERLTQVLGATDLAEDARFKAGRGRMDNIGELISRLAVYFKAKTTGEWLKLLEKAGVPAGPVLNVMEMHEHPQTIARNMVPYVEHPIAGRMQTIGLPIKFSETPGGVKHAAPLLGEHTREVLQEFGFGAADIDALVASKAVKAT